MKIEIIRERRKTICLRVDSSEKAVLKVPIRASEKEISKFLESKSGWLKKTEAKMKQKESFEQKLTPLEKAYLHGEFAGEFSQLISGFATMSQEKRNASIKKFYMSHFSDIERRANELSEQTKISFSSVVPTRSHRIWGSFSRDKKMKLNVFLVALPDELADYVIVHELCHSKEMNHSPKFWAEVEHFLPDFKKRKNLLSDFAFLLKI